MLRAGPYELTLDELDTCTVEEIANKIPEHTKVLVIADAGALIGDTRVKLNLIDVSDDTGRYRRAAPEELAAFRDALDSLGVPVVRRYSGGADIGAACGTLAATRRGGRLAIAGGRPSP